MCGRNSKNCLIASGPVCAFWEEKGSVPALQHPLTSAVSSVAHDKDKSGKRRSSRHKQIPAQITGEHTDLFQTANERRRALNREKRYALYEEVRALRQQGWSHYAIANALGLSR